MTSSMHMLVVGRNAASLPMPGDVRTEVAWNTLEAVRLLQSSHGMDAVVCEYNLPGKDGFYLMDWMRSHHEYEKVPFILVSPSHDKTVMQKALEKKTDDYFSLDRLTGEDLVERTQFLREYRRRSRKTKGAVEAATLYKMPLIKRLFDIFVASFALLLASPVLLVVIVAIRLESKGKVFFTSKRVGRKVFDFYKLRSMRNDADKMLSQLAKERNLYAQKTEEVVENFTDQCPICSLQGAGECTSPRMYDDSGEVCAYWFNQQREKKVNKKAAFVKIANDPRVTRVGKFIRNTSIDELPQLINVLKGDMSIVGNRPLPVYEAELLTADDLSKRFLAPAGLTGLWQVELRGRKGKMSEDERKQLDNEYADHFYDGTYSFWYDLKLILRTIPALFQRSSV